MTASSSLARGAAAALIGACAVAQAADAPVLAPAPDLGNFSVSLVVKDLAASKAFYEKLDFKQVGGKVEQRWVVLQNGNARIGLFQGMFDRNMMTFNPGWGLDKQPLAQFTDVRELQRTFKARGLLPTVAADENGDGPAHFMLTDPDGNPLLFDQHVPRPKQ